MTSYFVACLSPASEAAVHHRNHCAPGCFPQSAAEYLGEFLDPSQAEAVARLRYAHARRSRCCDTVPSRQAHPVPRPYTPS